MIVESIKDLINKEVKIDSIQTTFIVIEFEKKFYRIDIENKVEFYLKKGVTGKLTINDKHPLLTNHQEGFIITYINSSFQNTDLFFEKAEGIIDFETKGFRNWKIYFEDKSINLTIDIIKNNMAKGYGKLCEAPVSITNKIVGLCNELNIETKTFYHSNSELKSYKILFINDNFVIGKDFKLNLKN